MYLVLVVLFFLQLTLSDLVKVFGVKPDLGSLFVIFIAVFFGWALGLETGFVFGFLKDSYSLDVFGVNTVALALTGLAAGFLSPKIFRESKATQASIVFIFTLLYLSIHYVISSAVASISYIKFSEYLFLSFVPVSLYTAVISIPAFPLFIGWFGLKESAEYL